MLGKLTKVDLREVWKHEAYDFTKWLAQKENIDLLCNEIDINMQIIQTEANVGSFAVDILAEEENTGKKIIIENQLETTNHDHLGKLITYASGLEANYIIWLFKDIREEHKNAIDWLNEISNGQIGFFAIQMELWRINDSLIAPKFNTIVSPNNWAKAVKDSQNSNSMTDSNVFQIDYWNGFTDYIKQSKSFLKPRKARAQHWYDSSIGSSQAHLAFIISIRESFIRTELYINDNKELYNQLFINKNEIENKLGFELVWQELPEAKASRVYIKKDVKDIKDKKEMENAYAWYKEIGEKMAKVFQDYIK